MKNHKSNDEQLKEQLRKLPKIEDKRTKEEVFQQIEAQMKQDKPSSQKKRSFIWVPVLATVCAALLIFVIIQGQDFSRSYDQSTSEMADDSDMDTFDNADDEASTAEESREADIFNKAEMQDNIKEEYRYLLDMEDTQGASHMAFLTEQGQHIIPITILQSNFSYNQINEYIDLEENDLYDIGIREIQFQRENQKVIATFTDSFELQPSGNNYSNFEKVLAYMFRPLGMKEIQFENHHPILNEGDISNNLVPLSPIEQVPYKIYQSNNGAEWLAAKTDGIFKTLTAALEEMKIAEPAFNVQPSIPEDTVIETEDQPGGQVFVSLSSAQIGDNQITVQMIEAILATAFTYGYQEVIFSIGIDQIGKYDLSEPIQTTDQINIIQ
ncbi:GerMN domain-containing protein [Gracilibacillus lacisalsi]|uniref:GerMN domain-containing protein n=1 Tax=Gracilibacillus lacisalsi TaxID=393087 RepID=UPI000366E24C|nr:GerMN domain-containing protein [Gracilibacillus lacisalsi]